MFLVQLAIGLHGSMHATPRKRIRALYKTGARINMYWGCCKGGHNQEGAGGRLSKRQAMSCDQVTDRTQTGGMGWPFDITKQTE
jgi:hypothetical protein